MIHVLEKSENPIIDTVMKLSDRCIVLARPLAAAAMVSLAACGGSKPEAGTQAPASPDTATAPAAQSTGNAATSPQGVVPEIPDIEFALGREWVEAMLVENDGKLEEIRTRLQSVRRELDRMDASVVSDDLDELKTRMAELLAREERALVQIRETTEEMQGILKGRRE